MEPKWRAWVAEGLMRGEAEPRLRSVLTGAGFSRAQINEELRQAKAHPYLKAAQTFVAVAEDRGLARVLGEMARLHPDYGTVARRTGLSLADFLRDHYSQSRPVVLTDLTKDWAALQRWSLDYLKEKLGDYSLNLQPRPYTPESIGKMGFHEYVDQLDQPDARYMYSNPTGLRPGEALRADIDDLGGWVNDQPERPVQMLLGPPGALTPLHRDPCSNFLAQILGRKEVFLIPPFESQRVYAAGKFYSPVNCQQPDLQRFPEFAAVKIARLTLEPGEVLFLPAGWWHQVASLDLAISLSFENFAFGNATLNYQRLSAEQARGDYR
jgi:hypothetical protein